MKKGFYITIRNKAFLMILDSKQITQKIVFRFLDAAAENFKLDPVLIERIKQDPDSIKKLRQQITHADYIPATATRNYHTIYGKGVTANYDLERFAETVIIVEP